MKTTATFPTTRGPALMGTMATHFGHKIPVTTGDGHARIRFDGGDAAIAEASGGLHLSVAAADPGRQARL